jgi:hypothetical protein
VTFEVGNLIEEMSNEIFANELHEKIKEVRKDQGWDEFWLIFQQKPDMYLANVIRNGWTATNVKPQPISNTIHFYVNWKQGRIESMVFPPDTVNTDMYNYMPLDGKGELDYTRKLKAVEA